MSHTAHSQVFHELGITAWSELLLKHRGDLLCLVGDLLCLVWNLLCLVDNLLCCVVCGRAYFPNDYTDYSKHYQRNDDREHNNPPLVVRRRVAWYLSDSWSAWSAGSWDREAGTSRLRVEVRNKWRRATSWDHCVCSCLCFCWSVACNSSLEMHGSCAPRWRDSATD